MPVGEPFMIEAQQVQHRRVEVMDARPILNGAEAKLIRRTIRGSSTHSTPREPDAEPVVIMIAAQLGLARIAQFH